MINRNIYLAIVFFKFSDDDLLKEFDSEDNIICIDISDGESVNIDTNEGIYICIYTLSDISKEKAYSRIYDFLLHNEKKTLCTIISDVKQWDLSKKLLIEKDDCRICKIEIIFKVSKNQLDDSSDVLNVLNYCLSSKGLKSNSLSPYVKINPLSR